MSNTAKCVCLSLATAFSICLVGCEEGEGVDGTNEPSRQYDVCLGSDGEFVKPDNPTGDNPFLEPHDAGDTGFDRGWSYRVFARPHMESYSALDNWLYEGEHFVVDLGWLHYGVGNIDGTIMVLLDFEPVPFRLVEVASPDGYPGISDLDLEDESSLIMQEPMTLEDGVPFNGTLAVPASSFTRGNGAYDMRVVFIPNAYSSEEAGFDPYLQAIPGFAYRVLYGGCNPTTPPSIREATSEVASWTPRTKNLVANADFLFLAPPDSVYAWKEVEAPKDIRMHQRFTTSKDTLELTLYSLLTDVDKERGIDVEEVVYVVFEDDQIIDTFRMAPAFENQYGTREYYASVDQRPVARIEIPTAGKDAAQYTVMALVNPNEAPALTAPIGVKTSNSLSFEFVE